MQANINNTHLKYNNNNFYIYFLQVWGIGIVQDFSNSDVLLSERTIYLF